MRWVHRERIFFTLAVILPVLFGLVLSFAHRSTDVASVAGNVIELSPPQQCGDTADYKIY